jgi:hypothetical protein
LIGIARFCIAPEAYFGVPYRVVRFSFQHTSSLLPSVYSITTWALYQICKGMASYSQGGLNG